MNNLQEIWNDLDEAYEYMERAIEKIWFIRNFLYEAACGRNDGE